MATAHEHPRHLRLLLALGIAAACGPRLIEEDELTYRRCTFVLGTGHRADGSPGRTDSGPQYTHELCTCATDEELLDFSEGGYREYINELAFERCKELAREAGLVTHDCLEQYEANFFSMTYGDGPGNRSPAPLCSAADDPQGCQGRRL